MLNPSPTPYEFPDYPTATQEDIDYLVSFLDILYNKEHPHKYIIAEMYTNEEGTLPVYSYELENLRMKYEKGILIADDEQELLWNENHYIHTILIEHIDYITFHQANDWITLTIGDDDTYGLIIRIFY